MMSTKWNKWMAENLRYALRHNSAGQKISMTFAEYVYISNSGEAESHHWIDVVGKNDLHDKLSESVVIEIKSGMSDVLTGCGQNFVGKYNFFATDRKFCDRLLEHLQTNADKYAGVGLLMVDTDGSVQTILPAKEYEVESDFSFFCSNEEVVEFFEKIELPTQRQYDLQKIGECEMETICQK